VLSNPEGLQTTMTHTPTSRADPRTGADLGNAQHLHSAHHLRYWLVCAVAALSACAAPPQPTTADLQIAAAQASISHATDMGANEYAPTEIQSARNRLGRARDASVAGNAEQALRLSQEASKDVELAEARLQSAKAEEAAAALQEGRRVLQTEIQRKAP
jgi:hypothetical protein